MIQIQVVRLFPLFTAMMAATAQGQVAPGITPLEARRLIAAAWGIFVRRPKFSNAYFFVSVSLGALGGEARWTAL